MPQCGTRLEIGGIDSVIHDIDLRHTEIAAEQVGIRLADGNGASGLTENTALEGAELVPLPADVPALKWMCLRLEVALPDQRLDVMSHHNLAHSWEAAQGMGIGSPFDVPQIDGRLIGELTQCAA